MIIRPPAGRRMTWPIIATLMFVGLVAATISTRSINLVFVLTGGAFVLIVPWGTFFNVRVKVSTTDVTVGTQLLRRRVRTSSVAHVAVVRGELLLSDQSGQILARSAPGWWVEEDVARIERAIRQQTLAEPAGISNAK